MRALYVLPVCLMACAMPERRLSSRVVEDPIVLPRRLASVSVRPWVRYEQPSGDVDRAVNLGQLRVGLTNRLEWTNVLGLRYALLDDRPFDGRPPAPLSLAIGGGLNGFGYSSLEGVIVVPTLSLKALKRLGDRWALSFSATVGQRWGQHGISPGLSPRRWSWATAEVQWIRQLTATVAFGSDVTIHDLHDCVGFCRPAARSTRGSFFLIVRPVHWLTLSLRPSLGVIDYAPADAALDPNLPLPSDRERISTFSCELGLVFYL